MQLNICKEELKYKFFRCIESHVFHDNYFYRQNVNSMKLEIDQSIKRLNQILKKSSMHLNLSENEKKRYLSKKDLKRAKIKKDIIFLKKQKSRLQKTFSVKGRPKLLLKPTLLILGTIFYMKTKKVLNLNFNELFSSDLIKQDLSVIFKNSATNITVPLINNEKGQNIAELEKSIFKSLSVTNSAKKRLEKIALEFVCSDRERFNDLVAIGNRSLFYLDFDLYFSYYKMNDDRPLNEYSYRDTLSSAGEKEFLSTWKVLNNIDPLNSRTIT